MAQHEFTLPVPPTANLLWRFLVRVVKGAGFRVHPVPSKQYKAWKEQAAPFLPEASKDLYIENPRLAWGFWFWCNINHQSDLDNRIKATVDLVAGHYGLSDKWLDEVHVYRAEETGFHEPLASGWGHVYIRVRGDDGNAGQDDHPGE